MWIAKQRVAVRNSQEHWDARYSSCHYHGSAILPDKKTYRMGKKKTVSRDEPKVGQGKKTCPGCQTVIAARKTDCPHCRYKFVAKPERAKHSGSRCKESTLLNAVQYEQYRVEEPLQRLGRMELRLQTLKDLTGTVDD